MRIAFMGTPKFAADILQALIDDATCNIQAVYTMPDSVRSRGKKLSPTPVKIVAQNVDIPVFTPTNFSSAQEIANLKNLDLDFIFVAAYGIIIPQEVLDIPKYACLNVHGSLLPKWRGAAPVQHAILAGDKQTGISIMKMDSGMDTGDFANQQAFDIGNMNIDQIYKKMADIALPCLLDCANKIISGDIKWTKQDPSQATIANKILKRDLYLHDDDSAELAYRKIKASNDASPAKCILFGKSVRIMDANLKDGQLEITSIKPDGKQQMDWNSFIAGIQNADTRTIKWSSID